MFKQIIEFIGNLLFLYRNTQENTEAISQLRREMDEMADKVQKLASEIQRINDREKWNAKNWFCNWKTPCCESNVACRRENLPKIEAV